MNPVMRRDPNCERLLLSQINPNRRVKVSLRLGLGKSLFPVDRPKIKGRISVHNGIPK